MDRGGRWTREALTHFITDPNGFAEGTSMPDSGVGDPEVMAGVSEFLEALGNTEAYAFRRDKGDPGWAD